MHFGSGLDAAVHTASEMETVVARVRTFWDTIKNHFPNAVKWDVQPTVSVIDVQTGALEREYVTDEQPVQVSGQGSGPYPAPSGACIVWKTATVVSGKKLSGKTYLVPVVGSSFQDDGSLIASLPTTVVAATLPLIGESTVFGEQMVVWRRPRAGAPGAIGPVTQGVVADKAAILRSRRD
jgi:hypothetical protein